MISMPPGMMPAPMIAATQSPALSMLGKPIRMARAPGRLRQQPHRNLGDDAQQTLGTDDDAEQIVAASIGVFAAQPDDVAVDRDELDPDHVVGGQAVFQAVHAAGVFRHVAADGAGDLAGRVRRVVEALRLHRLRDGEIGDAGLDDGAAIGNVDLQDLLEFAEAEQNAVGQRQGAAGERGAGAAGDDLDVRSVAITQNFDDLFRGLRQHDDHRQRAIGGERVGLVRPAPGLAVDHAFARHDLLQRADDLGTPRQHGLVRFRHCQHGARSGRPAAPALRFDFGHILPRPRRFGQPATAALVNLRRPGRSARRRSKRRRRM